MQRCQRHLGLQRLCGGCSDCEDLGLEMAWGTAARLELQWRLVAAAFCGAWALQRGLGVAAGSCCELRAAERRSDCEGTWGLQRQRGCRRRRHHGFQVEVLGSVVRSGA